MLELWAGGVLQLLLEDTDGYDCTNCMLAGNFPTGDVGLNGLGWTGCGLELGTEGVVMLLPEDTS